MHIRQLRSQPGGHGLIWGSLSLMRQLLSAGLVDELELLIAPIALGKGTQLVEADHPVELSLTGGDVWQATGSARDELRLV